MQIADAIHPLLSFPIITKFFFLSSSSLFFFMFFFFFIIIFFSWDQTPSVDTNHIRERKKRLKLWICSCCHGEKKPKTLDHGENKKLKKALDLLLVVIERKKLWIFCCCCGDGEKTGA
jgi:hypothetical protein